MTEDSLFLVCSVCKRAFSLRWLSEGGYFWRNGIDGVFFSPFDVGSDDTMCYDNGLQALFFRDGIIVRIGFVCLDNELAIRGSRFSCRRFSGRKIYSCQAACDIRPQSHC